MSQNITCGPGRGILVREPRKALKRRWFMSKDLKEMKDQVHVWGKSLRLRDQQVQRLQGGSGPDVWRKSVGEQREGEEEGMS